MWLRDIDEERRFILILVLIDCPEVSISASYTLTISLNDSCEFLNDMVAAVVVTLEQEE